MTLWIEQRGWTQHHIDSVIVFSLKGNYKTSFCNEVEDLSTWNSTSVAANVTDLKLTKPEHKIQTKLNKQQKIEHYNYHSLLDIITYNLIKGNETEKCKCDF